MIPTPVRCNASQDNVKSCDALHSKCWDISCMPSNASQSMLQYLPLMLLHSHLSLVKISLFETYLALVKSQYDIFCVKVIPKRCFKKKESDELRTSPLFWSRLITTPKGFRLNIYVGNRVIWSNLLHYSDKNDKITKVTYQGRTAMFYKNIT